MGTSSIVLVDACQFLDAHGSDMGLDACTSMIQNLSAEQSQTLSGKGLKLFQTTLKASELLWIPCGYICACRGDNEGGLLYGLRKSYFDDGPHAKAALSAISKMMKADSRTPTRLDEVFGLYKA